jgi:hypothetical protein
LDGGGDPTFKKEASGKQHNLPCVILQNYIPHEKAHTKGKGKASLRTFDDLLKKGANLDSRDSDSGATPLMYAMLLGDPKLVKHLLEKGANPNFPGKAGATPLVALVNFQHKKGISAPVATEMAKILLDYKAKPNIPFNDCDAMARAKFLGQNNLVRLFEQHGARLDQDAYQSKFKKLKREYKDQDTNNRFIDDETAAPPGLSKNQKTKLRQKKKRAEAQQAEREKQLLQRTVDAWSNYTKKKQGPRHVHIREADLKSWVSNFRKRKAAERRRQEQQAAEERKAESARQLQQFLPKISERKDREKIIEAREKGSLQSFRDCYVMPDDGSLGKPVSPFCSASDFSREKDGRPIMMTYPLNKSNQKGDPALLKRRMIVQDEMTPDEWDEFLARF